MIYLYIAIGFLALLILAVGYSCLMLSGRISEIERQAEDDSLKGEQ